MTIKVKVPSMVCEGCVETITTEIKTHLPEAQVDIDLNTKMVSVETNASEASVKEMIVVTGHTVE